MSIGFNIIFKFTRIFFNKRFFFKVKKKYSAGFPKLIHMVAEFEKKNLKYRYRYFASLIYFYRQFTYKHPLIDKIN